MTGTSRRPWPMRPIASSMRRMGARRNRVNSSISPTVTGSSAALCQRMRRRAPSVSARSAESSRSVWLACEPRQLARVARQLRELSQRLVDLRLPAATRVPCSIVRQVLLRMWPVTAGAGRVAGQFFEPVQRRVEQHAVFLERSPSRPGRRRIW